MGTGGDAGAAVVRLPSAADFDVFYDDAMPIVYGYLVRLCGGDTEQAWDLTQDTWLAVVDHMQRGRSDCTTVPFVLTVARSRFLDVWRRRQRLQRKLRLVWAADRQRDGAVPSRESVLDHVAACSPRHRMALMMAYVDDMPVAQIAAQLGCSPASAYALLAKARDELRSQITGDR
jgi:RNA polymerase sigma-70 factor (ECF subfamily)